MNPVYKSLICLVAVGCALVLVVSGDQKQQVSSVTEEMHLINKSLEGLLNELALIKREATGRLSQMKMNRISSSSPANEQSERIRQTKVSKFVLKRVAELEMESMGMRDEMAKLFELQKKTSTTPGSEVASSPAMAELKQEDHDFDEAPSTSSSPSAPTTTTGDHGMPATSTLKPEEEAQQIGFDLEALKKLGEEIGKRVDQFGKDAAKNLADLMEGIKLVFREPGKSQPKARPDSPLAKLIQANTSTVALKLND